MLAARDEEHLRTIESRLVDHDVLYTAIHEPDEPYNGQLMAIGLAPIPRSQGRFLSNLPLYRGQILPGASNGGSKPIPAPIRGSSSVKEHSQERSMV